MSEEGASAPIKQRMVQNECGLVHKSLYITCPKFTYRVLILALGGSRGHSKDWTASSENRPSPSALRTAIATVGQGFASAFKPRHRLWQGPSSKMVLLMVADVVRHPHLTHASLSTRDPTCRPPLQGVVSPQKVESLACTKGSIKQRMVQNTFSLKPRVGQWCKKWLVVPQKGGGLGMGGGQEAKSKKKCISMPRGKL